MNNNVSKESRDMMTKRITNIATLCMMIAMALFVYYGIKFQLFNDVETLKAFILKGGLIGPIIFMMIQVIQVVIPIIPGGISCAAGVLLFGPWYGLLYNYVGIVIGSCINFYLARTYGISFVKKFVSEETYEKYANWLDKGKKFDIFFALAIFFPVAPDDFLCMLAGLTKMSFQRFSLIILLGKPASIAAYSFALVYAGEWIGRLLGM